MVKIREDFKKLWEENEVEVWVHDKFETLELAEDGEGSSERQVCLLALDFGVCDSQSFSFLSTIH